MTEDSTLSNHIEQVRETVEAEKDSPHSSRVSDADCSSFTSSTSSSRSPTPSFSLVAESSKASPPTRLTTAQRQEQEDAFMELLLTQVAKQLEFYFSPSNLSTDTYLQTLQGLNDGCVPVSILANFARIKALLWATPALTRRFADQETRAQIILQAMPWSDVLQLEAIDTATGRIVPPQDYKDEPTETREAEASASTTIWAIRPIPVTNNEEQGDTTTESEVLLPSTGFTNTILLRDVQPTVTQDQVLDLFLHQVNDCPPVISVQCDVANCWFVTLDASDRDTMLRVVLQLRGLTLGGDYVHARLKSQPPATVLEDPEDPVATVVAAATTLHEQKRRRKKRGAKKRGAKNKSGTASVAGNKSSKNGADSSKQEKKQTPPSLGNEEFPTLLNNTVEWATPLVEGKDDCEEDEDEDEEPRDLSKALSDAGSTATTTSSSMESVPRKVLAGYAAAVLKPAPAEACYSKTVEASSAKEGETATCSGTPPSLFITPPSWGGERSFADATRSSSKC